MLSRMVSRNLLAACSLAAAVCFQAAVGLQAGAQATAAPAGSGNGAPSSTSAPAPQSTPPLQFHDLPPEPHTLTPAEEEQARQQRVLAAATRIAIEQAHWGPEISTPGLAIRLVETGRTKGPGGTTISYQITGTGFAPADRLSLVRWPLNSDYQTVMSGIAFDDKGVAVCAAPAPPAPANLSSAPRPEDVPPQPTAPSCTKSVTAGQPIEIQATAAAGEAIRVALLNGDRKRGAATSAVPFPIADQDKSCRLQILLGTKDAGMVLVEGTGFPPNASMKLDASSWGTNHVLSTKTNGEGRMTVLVLPEVTGHDAGETTVKLAGNSAAPSLENSRAPAAADPGCDPAVNFHWGKGTYKTE